MVKAKWGNVTAQSYRACHPWRPTVNLVPCSEHLWGNGKVTGPLLWGNARLTQKLTASWKPPSNHPGGPRTPLFPGNEGPRMCPTESVCRSRLPPQRLSKALHIHHQPRTWGGLHLHHFPLWANTGVWVSPIKVTRDFTGTARKESLILSLYLNLGEYVTAISLPQKEILPENRRTKEELGGK